jgi:hypothetical protein
MGEKRGRRARVPAQLRITGKSTRFNGTVGRALERADMRVAAA